MPAITQMLLLLVVLGQGNEPAGGWTWEPNTRLALSDNGPGRGKRASLRREGAGLSVYGAGSASNGRRMVADGIYELYDKRESFESRARIQQCGRSRSVVVHSSRTVGGAGLSTLAAIGQRQAGRVRSQRRVAAAGDCPRSEACRVSSDVGGNVRRSLPAHARSGRRIGRSRCDDPGGRAVPESCGDAVGTGRGAFARRAARRSSPGCPTGTRVGRDQRSCRTYRQAVAEKSPGIGGQASGRGIKVATDCPVRFDAVKGTAIRRKNCGVASFFGDS